MSVICRPHFSTRHIGSYSESQWEAKHLGLSPPNFYSSWIAFMYSFSFNNGLLLFFLSFSRETRFPHVTYRSSMNWPPTTSPVLSLASLCLFLYTSAIMILLEPPDASVFPPCPYSCCLLCLKHNFPSPTRLATHHLKSRYQCTVRHIEFITVRVRQIEW